MTAQLPDQSASIESAAIREGRRGTALVLAAAVGLIFALAATINPLQLELLSGIPKQLIIDLPEWLILVVVAALGTATLLLCALISPWPLRRRRKDDYEIYHEPHKMTPSEIAVVGVIAVLPLVLCGLLLWYSQILSPTHLPGGGSTRMEMVIPHAASPSPSQVQPEPSVTHSPTASAILGTLAVLAAVGALGLMLWLYFGDWKLRSRARSPSAIKRLDMAIDKSLDDLKFEPDFRRAIVKCYRQFEHVLASADFPRASWQTPIEFMRSVLHVLRLPSDAVRDLTWLFEIARFSQYPIDARDRDKALQALAAIRTALSRREAAHGR